MDALIAELVERLNQRADAAEMRLLLKEILLSAISDDIPCQHHPFGFVVFQLKQASGFATLRLHIWPESERRSQAYELFVHNHIYSFTSLVLTGRLRENRYRCQISEEPTRYSVFKVRYEGDRSVLERDATYVSVGVLGSFDRMAGTYYSVQTDDFHSVVAEPDQLCATLVLASPSKPGEQPLVIGPADDQSSYSFRRVDVAPLVRRQLLETLFG